MRRQLIQWMIGALILALLAIPAGVQAQGEEWRCAQVSAGGDLNVRSDAGTNFDIVVTLVPGQQLEADYANQRTANGYEWVPVRFGSTRGWTITARLEACPASSDPGPAPTSEPPPADTGDTNAGGQSEGVNQDGVLDRFEIEQIASSVVLVANVQDDRIVATGTGTITTAEGLIITNAHVVEDAEVVVIGVLTDINDPPELQYVGEVVSADSNIDVALVAIRYNRDGQRIESSTLNLPYIPVSLAPDEVFRGDNVYIFGYPGIGDDYLVVTTGSIVSVENGEVNGERVPVWYRTDAEIAPGNSGGLVVNGNGDFVGIPTFVRSESTTGGRLGGIRPAEVALMSVSGEAMVFDGADSTPGEETPAVEIEVLYGSVVMEHGVMVDGEPGIRILVTFGLDGWQQRDALVTARFYYDDLRAERVVNPNAPGVYRDKNNGVLTSTMITPCCETTDYDSLELFIPYSALGFNQPGTYALKYQIAIMDPDELWQRTLGWEFITYTQG